SLCPASSSGRGLVAGPAAGRRPACVGGETLYESRSEVAPIDGRWLVTNQSPSGYESGTCSTEYLLWRVGDERRDVFQRPYGAVAPVGPTAARCRNRNPHRDRHRDLGIVALSPDAATARATARGRRDHFSSEPVPGSAHGGRGGARGDCIADWVALGRGGNGPCVFASAAWRDPAIGNSSQRRRGAQGASVAVRLPGQPRSGQA